MAGKVHKVSLFAPFKIDRLLPDLHFLRWWFVRRRKRDNKDDSLLLDVIAEFDREGIHFGSALEICPELLVKAGCHTRRKPSPSELADVAFGWVHAKEMGRLDIGQSVVVKMKTVIAVEAVEGTDRCILRSGELCPRGGFTVVKVAKPQQDMRFDVPTVGPTTIENMKKAGGSMLAIETGQDDFARRRRDDRRGRPGGDCDPLAVGSGSIGADEETGGLISRVRASLALESRCCVRACSHKKEDGV